jgi:nucleoside 2-deoxyribosyltransferase
MSDESRETLTYFHAGALFTLSELAGNALMAQAILRESGGRYRAALPQNFAIETNHPTAIRDADLRELLSADVALFHFDGPELDSGTVVEFMVAKFADIPAVVLRSDFRRGGDSAGDAWNLMLSGYPRTRQVIVHAMERYHQQRDAGRALEDAAERATHETAREVIAAFDEVRRMPAVLTADLREPVYRWLARFPAFRAPAAEMEKVFAQLLRGKVERGLV